jgi:hypothetical protein
MSSQGDRWSIADGIEVPCRKGVGRMQHRGLKSAGSVVRGVS